MSDKFHSRTSFIMASVGSAVGLGNIFRFPALAVKYGVVYIIIYVVLLITVGLPLLMSELAMGRKYGGSVIKCMEKINPKLSSVGWLCCSNSFVIMTYYCLLFSYVLLAAVFSFRLVGVSSDSAANIFQTYLYPDTFPLVPLLFLIASWAAVILCFGKAERLGKISTAGVVFAAVVIGLLAVLRGFSYPQNLLSFCHLSVYHLLKPSFWRDVMGQVFFSLSVMVGVMHAYGSFLNTKENIVTCSFIIALFDLAVSLAATVIYATMVQDSSAGLLACFSVYPKAFCELGGGVLGAIIAFLFYTSIALLCLDSVFSYLKSISRSLYDKFGKNETIFAVLLCCVSAFFGVFLLGKPGANIIDMLDGKITPVITLIVGLFEIAVFIKLSKTQTLLTEINRGFKKGFSSRLYNFSIKVLSPSIILALILSEILF